MRRYDDCAILPRVRSFGDLARGAVIQRLAQSFVVVEIEVGGNTRRASVTLWQAFKYTSDFDNPVWPTLNPKNSIGHQK
jgi:hypothetical protein